MQLPIAPKVIFTTAFTEYALEAFDNNAIDYVLKPVSLARLEKTCEKFKLLITSEVQKQSELMELDSQFFVKVLKSLLIL